MTVLGGFSSQLRGKCWKTRQNRHRCVTFLAKNVTARDRTKVAGTAVSVFVQKLSQLRGKPDIFIDFGYRRNSFRVKSDTAQENLQTIDGFKEKVTWPEESKCRIFCIFETDYQFNAMRRSAIILSIAALGILFGCTESEKTPVMMTEVIEFEEATPLYEDAPYNYTLKMKVEWPEGGVEAEALENIQKGITELLFGNELETIDLEYAMKEYNRRGVEMYLEENLEYVEDTEEEWGFMMNWSEDIEGSFLPKYNDMISYVVYTYGYSGGAHGIDARTCRTFDIKTGEEILEQDIFRKGYEERLTEALNRNLMLSYEDPEMFFVTNICPSENFYVSSEGITYIYQRYEIGPYAIGIVEVLVPWKEIQDIIR